MGRKKKNKMSLTEENSKVEQVKTEVQTPTKETSKEDIAKIQKEFFEITYFQRKQRGNLLGSFENGKYKISNEQILKGLIDIPKKYEIQEGNIIRVSVKLNEFVLNFRIDLDINESYCTAKLFLIETEQDAVESIKHVSEIDSRVEPYSPNFISDTLAFWHVYMNENPYEKDDFLLNYLAMQKEEYAFSLELSAILSQLYIVRMMNLLDGMGELGDKIRYEYKVLMEKLLLEDPGLSQDFVMQKVYLDRILEKNNAYEEILKLPEGPKALKGFSTPLKNVRDKTYPSVIVEAPKKEKAEEKKEDTKPAKKSASKSKSKGKSSEGAKAPKIDFIKALKNGLLPVNFSNAQSSVAFQKPAAKKPTQQQTNQPQPTNKNEAQEGVEKEKGVGQNRPKQLIVPDYNEIDNLPVTQIEVSYDEMNIPVAQEEKVKEETNVPVDNGEKTFNETTEPVAQVEITYDETKKTVLQDEKINNGAEKKL